MVDFFYLQSGLAALSRAHRAGGMAGHLGGALLAGYFFSELRAELDPGVYLGIERDLERVMRGEEDFWFDQKKKGITIPELFAPLPKGGAVKKSAKRDVGGVVAAFHCEDAAEWTQCDLRIARDSRSRQSS
ncbi:MAG: hypothetical protein P1U86_09265 [Verrucomicrobiales bacterium]|nr:hypothetical protein [Verrucomicrobiales bacterium]